MREGIPHLPQVPRQRPQPRSFRPVEPGGRHQGVDLVALGLAGPNRPQSRFDPRSVISELWQATRQLQHHVVDEPFHPVARYGGIGALVDHHEPECLQHRHALAQGQGRFAMVELQPQRAATGLALPQPDGDVLAVAQAPQDLDILKRCRSIVPRPVGIGEGVAIVADGGRIPGLSRQQVTEIAGQRRNLGFQFASTRPRRRSAHATDDDVEPHQLPFREMRVVGGNPPIIDPGQVARDPDPRLYVVAVARHVHEDGDEIVEPVDARQHPHAWPVM